MFRCLAAKRKANIRPDIAAKELAKQIFTQEELLDNSWSGKNSCNSKDTPRPALDTWRRELLKSVMGEVYPSNKGLFFFLRQQRFRADFNLSVNEKDKDVQEKSVGVLDLKNED